MSRTYRFSCVYYFSFLCESIFLLFKQTWLIFGMPLIYLQVKYFLEFLLPRETVNYSRIPTWHVYVYVDEIYLKTKKSSRVLYLFYPSFSSLRTLGQGRANEVGKNLTILLLRFQISWNWTECSDIARNFYQV
jgi:hypothetical protein